MIKRIRRFTGNCSDDYLPKRKRKKYTINDTFKITSAKKEISADTSFRNAPKCVKFIPVNRNRNVKYVKSTATRGPPEYAKRDKRGNHKTSCSIDINASLRGGIANNAITELTHSLSNCANSGRDVLEPRKG